MSTMLLVLAKAGLERLDLCNGEDYTVTPFDAELSPCTVSGNSCD